MTNKKLTPQEILRALADGKEIDDGACRLRYKFVNGGLYCRSTIATSEFDYIRVGNERIGIISDATIYTPPKPKNLLERFAERFEVELAYDAGHLYTSHDGNMLGDIAYWLDKQPESRLATKKKLSERFIDFSNRESLRERGIPTSGIQTIYNWLKENEDEA